MNYLPKHYGAGPQRRGTQCSCIGCIDLRPALVIWNRFLYIIVQSNLAHICQTENVIFLHTYSKENDSYIIAKITVGKIFR